MTAGTLVRGVVRTLVSLVVVGGGCVRSPAHEIAKEMQSAASAAATLEMALASWLSNRVPTAFAARVVVESRAHLEESARALSQAPEGRVGASLVRDVLSVTPAGGALARSDSAATRALLRDLHVRTTRLRAAVDSARRAPS